MLFEKKNDRTKRFSIFSRIDFLIVAYIVSFTEFLKYAHIARIVSFFPAKPNQIPEMGCENKK